MKPQTQKRINFLPAELRPTFFNHRTFTALLAIALVGLPCSFGALKVMNYQAEAERAQLAAERDKLSQEIQKLLKQRDSSPEKAQLEAVTKAVSERVSWSDIFKELGNISPDRVWLTDFEAKSGADGRLVTLAGRSPAQAQVAELLTNIESSFYFRDVRMKLAEAQEDLSPRQFRFHFEGKIFSPGRKGAANGTD